MIFIGKRSQKGSSGIRNKKVVKGSKIIGKAHHETFAMVKSKISTSRLPHTTITGTNAKLCKTEKMNCTSIRPLTRTDKFWI